MAVIDRKELFALDEAQRRAVDDQNELVLVEGSPGTGVTHVICHRILKLAARHSQPSKILCLTASAQQAEAIIRRFQEMKEHSFIQMSDATGGERSLWEERLRVSEAALAVRVMSVEQYVLDSVRRNEALLMGIPRDISLWGRHRSLQCLSRITAQGTLVEQPGTGDLAEILHCQRRNSAHTESDFMRLRPDSGIPACVEPQHVHPVWDEIVRLHEEEQGRQRATSIDTLVRTASDAIQKETGWIEEDGLEPSDVLVDGAQDMTPAALAFIVRLRESSRSFTVAGNFNTGVPGWMGGNNHRMLHFEGLGYAFSRHSLQTQHGASGTLAGINDRMADILGIKSDSAHAMPASGHQPELLVCDDHAQMFDHLMGSLYLNSNLKYRTVQMAWLFRHASTMMKCRRRLEAARVSYTLLGESPGLWDEDASRVMALLSSVLNPDDVEAFRVVAGTRAHGSWQPLNHHAVAVILDTSITGGMNFVEAARRHARGLRKGSPMRKGLEAALGAWDALKGDLLADCEVDSLRDWCQHVLEMLTIGGPSDAVHSHDLYRLLKVAHDFERRDGEGPESLLRRFVDHLELGGDSLARTGEYALGTVFGARGLRWDHVWVVEAGHRFLVNSCARGPGPGRGNHPFREELQILFSAATRSSGHITFLTLPGSDLERIWPELVGDAGPA